jgi:hypothetical protein
MFRHPPIRSSATVLCSILVGLLTSGCSSGERSIPGSAPLSESEASGGGVSADLVRGQLLFPNVGLNAIQVFDPVTRTVVRAIPLPTGYTYNAPPNLLTVLVRSQDRSIFTNAREAGTGTAVALLLAANGAFRAATPSGGAFLQQLAFDPLDPTQRRVLGGAPFLPSIVSVNPYGGVTTRVTTPGGNFIGLITDSAGAIYGGNYSSGKLERYTADGQPAGVAVDVLAATGSVEINGVTSDTRGDFYIAQNSSNRLARFTSAGSFVGYLTHPAFNFPAFAFFNPADRLLYVGNQSDGNLVILTTTGFGVAVVPMGGYGVGTAGVVP